MLPMSVAHTPWLAQWLQDGYAVLPRFWDARTVSALPDSVVGPWWALEDATVEVKAGSLVLPHGKLPHASSANTSGRSRLAVSLHLVDGAAAYSPLNWLQRDAGLPLQGF
jgi:ectoine hydroxylase-related dioxygenase (phytanoyl-CoA dioxygenase family)